MMKYYISQTTVGVNENGAFVWNEAPITKPDARSTAENSLRRFRNLGIEHLHLCEHPEGSRRWGKLDRAASKLLKTRKMTKADVAKDIAELDAESNRA
tara:strand:+ start:187 stop:480 length:294 start_codon:yes stop_codon:yes gene_type:complete